MNICEARHEPKYLITYKSVRTKYSTPSESAASKSYAPVWLVCEACMENKQYFGAQDNIETMEILP